MNKKKVALVTGAAGFLGEIFIEAMQDLNCKLVVADKNLKGLNLIEKKIKKKNNEYLILKLDVTKKKDIKSSFEKIIKKFNKIDLIILNAAAYNPGHLDFANLSKIKYVMDTNLMGQMNCISSVLPIMRRKNSGQIVFVSSPAGFKGLPNAGIYGITKSALTFLAESMYLELLKTNIKVQVIHPGFIKTPMTDKNTFPMPFLMSSENAARRIYKKLSSYDFEIYFPKRLIIPMKILSILPYKLYFFIMSKILNNTVKLPLK